MHSGKIIIIPYKVEAGAARFVDSDTMRKEAPETYDYLLQSKGYLEKRENGRMKGSDWYAYIYPKNIDIMRKPKILIPDIANRASFAYDASGEYSFTSGYAITFKDGVKEAPTFFLGLLNSRVLDFYLKHISTSIRGGYFRFFTQYIEQLPIRKIDFSDAADKNKHDHIVKLVDQMLRSKEALAAAKTDAEVNRLELQCESLDRQIDEAVYELYGLTEEEIKIVEGK